MFLMDGNEEIRVKLIYENILIVYFKCNVSYNDLCNEINRIYSFRRRITIKWIDGGGDFCTVSSQIELDESFRLQADVKFYIFAEAPSLGEPCYAEFNFYNKSLKKFEKYYKHEDHLYEPKRLTAACFYCHQRMWAFGKLGLKCLKCKLQLHKRCYRKITETCTNQRNMMDLISKQKLEENYVIENYIQEEETRQSVNEEKVIENRFGLDDFDLIQTIGKGGYSKVLKVQLKTTKEFFAMKIIKKTIEKNYECVQAEKEVFKTVTNHPFFVGLHSCFQTPTRLIFVIDYVSGGDLMYHVLQRKKFPEAFARFYAAEICLALHYLHTNGIIYRDLKLDNVLLDKDGHIKLTDFGLSKSGLGENRLTSTFCGTPNYLAPEIVNSQCYDYSVDWWALGVLLYEMLTGRSPFEVEETHPDFESEEYCYQLIMEKIIRIPRNLTVKAAKVLKELLNRNPKERLGCRGDEPFNDVMEHPFFVSIEWDLLREKRVTPPFVPAAADNVHEEFTKDPARLTPEDVADIETIDQTEYESFDYVNTTLYELEKDDEK